MSIEIGSKVKIKEGTEPGFLVGEAATVVDIPENSKWDWEWALQLDSDKDAGPYGYDTDELEVIK